MKRIILCGGIAALLTGQAGCMQAKQTRYRKHLSIAVKPIKDTGRGVSLARGSSRFSDEFGR